MCDISPQLKHKAQLQAKTDDDGEEENRSRSKNIKAPVIFSIPLLAHRRNVEETTMNNKNHKRSFHVFMNVDARGGFFTPSLCAAKCISVIYLASDISHKSLGIDGIFVFLDDVKDGFVDGVFFT